MSPLLYVIAIVMIPASLLPIVTAFVLRRYRSAPSQALRARGHVSLALAALGAVTGFLAIGAITDIELGTGFWAAFGLVIVAVDIVSGKWLLDYLTGGFAERVGGGPETEIEHEDRIVGDERRRLQEQARDDEA
jgi:hypothetical protein